MANKYSKEEEKVKEEVVQIKKKKLDTFDELKDMDDNDEFTKTNQGFKDQEDEEHVIIFNLEIDTSSQK